MKFLTYILAFTVIFLSVKPAIDAIPFSSESQQTCCSSSKCNPISDNDNSQDQNQDNDCDGKSCNPFQVCGSWVLVCLNIPFDYLPKPQVFSQQGFTYQSIFISQFASDFWQPPKIV